MRPSASPRIALVHAALLLSIAAALSLPLGCGDDGTGGPGGDDREAARAVLAVSLPAALQARDAAAYSSLLHPYYRFTFVEGDAPGDLPGGFWGRESEASAIGSLLSDDDVAGIRFVVSILGDSMVAIPGEPGTWEYRAATIVAARLASAGSDDTTLAASAVAYLLRTDDADGEWKVYDEKEIVQGKGAALPSEDLRWGEAKALYYEPLAPPSSRTLLGTVVFRSSGGTPVEGAVVTAGSSETTTDENGFFEIDEVPSSVTSFTVEHPGALFAIFGIGGGDEVYRVDVGVQPFAVQGTPDETIEHEFPRAYTTMDSVHYASLLDSRYQFELLPDEIDPSMPDPWWDLSEELGIAGKMFKGRPGDHGVTVRSIDLSLLVKTMVVDNTHYAGKPEGEIWYKATASVDLVVVANDSFAPDGSGITNFIVTSDQIFILRPDPAHGGRYLVYRQTDQPSITGGKGGTSATGRTENTSWGSVKSLWR